MDYSQQGNASSAKKGTRKGPGGKTEKRKVGGREKKERSGLSRGDREGSGKKRRIYLALSTLSGCGGVVDEQRNHAATERGKRGEERGSRQAGKVSEGEARRKKKDHRPSKSDYCTLQNLVMCNEK